MIHRSRFDVRGFAPNPGSILATLLLFAAGCQSGSRQRSAEESIFIATGSGELVTFRVEGGPLDEHSDHDTSLPAEEAVRRAVATDPGLQAALARVRIAMADADQARLLPNPVLNFIVRWGPGKPQIEVSLAQDLMQCLQIPRRASAADNRLGKAAADAVAVALDVVADVQERYTEVQAIDRVIPLLEGRVDLLRKLGAIAKDRLEAGEGVRGDVTTLEAQRVALEVEIADARLQRNANRLRLARLIGEPSGAGTWVLDPWADPVLGTEPEARWVDAALTHRPEVQAVAWQLAALGDEYALTGLAPWEGLSLGVDSQRDDQSFFTGPSIATPIPIFDMGQAKRARATAEQVEARHDLTLAKRKVVEEVRVAYQSLLANEANVRRVTSELIPLQQLRRQQAEDAYRAGQTDVTPLFLAEQDLEATQVKAIDIERQTVLAMVRLRRAVGGPGFASSVGAAAQASPVTSHADSRLTPDWPLASARSRP